MIYPQVALWNMSSTFTGFVMATGFSPTVTLSTSAPTVVDLAVPAPSGGVAQAGELYPPRALAVSGGFNVVDPATGAQLDVGALVASSGTEPGSMTTWNSHIIFPPQATATTVLVQGFATFAMFSPGL